MFYGTYCPFCFARKEKGFGIVSCVSSYALKGPWDQIAMDIHNGFKEGDYVSQGSKTLLGCSAGVILSAGSGAVDVAAGQASQGWPA